MHLTGSLVIAGDVVIIGGRGTRGVRGARVLKLVQDDLSDHLAHGDPCAAKFPFAEVVASRVVMVVLYLSLFQREITGVALACEVVAVGVAAPTPVRTGGGHLVSEEAVVAGDSAPARCQDGAEVVRHFAVSGEVVVPRAIGASPSLLELFLG
jgi:hypothetical protein